VPVSPLKIFGRADIASTESFHEMYPKSLRMLSCVGRSSALDTGCAKSTASFTDSHSAEEKESLTNTDSCASDTSAWNHVGVYIAQFDSVPLREGTRETEDVELTGARSPRGLRYQGQLIHCSVTDQNHGQACFLSTSQTKTSKPLGSNPDRHSFVRVQST